MAGIKKHLEGVAYREPREAARYFASGAWIDITIGDALRRTAARVPDRIAFCSEEGREITFRQLDEQSERLGAALLDLGFTPGDRAIFQMGTVLETVVALTACFKAGILPVATVAQYREIEIGQLTDLSGAVGYFVQADFSAFDLVGFARSMQAKHPGLKHLVVARAKGPGAYVQMESLIESVPLEAARKRLAEVEIGTEDCFIFQLSGGSTGVPKIIPRFHAEYLGHSAAWSKILRVDEHSIGLWSLPIIHNAGQIWAYMPTLLWGRTMVLMSRVDIPLMLELMARRRVTESFSIGPIAPQMLAYKDIRRHDLSSLRYFISMGNSRAIEAHLGVKMSNLYGITEGLLMTGSPDSPAAVRHNTHGFSGCPDDEIRIVEPGTDTPVRDGELGELTFRGPSSLRGYYNAPDLTRETVSTEGFVHTGDLAIAHTIEGVRCYSFEGRTKDNINRGGEKYGTFEVENLIRLHPDVSDVAIVPMPDPVYLERACAYVIARPGAAVPELKTLGDFLIAQGLAKFKLPERVEPMTAFPVTRVGKLDKLELRKSIAHKLEEERGKPA